MNAVKYAAQFVTAEGDTRRRLTEAFWSLAWARLLVALPFRWVAPSLGASSRETPGEAPGCDRNELLKIAAALHRISRHTPWDSRCIVRAIAAMRMLERRGMESTLYLGTAKDAGGRMVAHAWLRCGSFYVTGAEEMRKFTVVAKFAKRPNTAGQEG
jgi:hypothetical protein